VRQIEAEIYSQTCIKAHMAGYEGNSHGPNIESTLARLQEIRETLLKGVRRK